MLCEGLSLTCHLFTRCVRLPGCRGCSSGPRDCEAECRVPPVRGGGWYCDGTNQTNEVTQASSLQTCYYLCEGSSLQRLTCLSGNWDQGLEDSQRFTCNVNRHRSFALNISIFIIHILGSITQLTRKTNILLGLWSWSVWLEASLSSPPSSHSSCFSRRKEYLDKSILRNLP